MAICIDCVPSSKRPAPWPGPRCATHNRARLLAKKEHNADVRRWNFFGVSATRYKKIIKHQGGGCGICGGKSSRRLAMDHDHKCCPGNESCGKCVRGALCMRCNSTLASYRDNVDVFRRIIAYLEDPPAYKVPE